MYSSSGTPLDSPHNTVMRGLATPLVAGGTPSASALNTSHSHLNASLISSDIHSDVTKAELLASEWVTVFGFPVASASYILTQFAQLGTIVDQRMAGSGNWMHLKFHTPLQARKALSLNSKVFGGNIMIGVVPCTDKLLVHDNKENRTLNTSTQQFGTPGAADTSALNNTSMIANTSLSTPKANIRSLTQAYQTTPSDNQVSYFNKTPCQ